MYRICMSIGDFTTMQDEVKSRLADININHLHSISQPVFGGGANNMDILQLDGKTGNASFNLVDAKPSGIYASLNNNLVSYDTIFKDFKELNIDASVSSILSQISNLQLSEINCISLLYHNIHTNINTIKYIYGLYGLYAILNSEIWDVFISNIKNNKSNSDLNINIPVYNQRKNTITRVNIAENIPKLLMFIDPQLINQLIQIKDFNVFIARRIVYMWILMYNFSIAYNYSVLYPTHTNNNLALVCLAVLISNNNTFKYSDALHDSVQNSEYNQLANLKYQLWCIIVQTIVPYTLGSLDISNGILSIHNTSDTCTHITPEAALNNLQNNFNILSKNYNLVTSTNFNSIQQEIIEGLGNYTNMQCINSVNRQLHNDLDSLKNATNTTNANIDAINSDAYNANTNANTTQSDIYKTFNTINNQLVNVNSAQQTVVEQDKIVIAQEQINNQLAYQGYALVQAGQVIVSPNPIYTTRTGGVINTAEPLEQQFLQIYRIARQNGVTNYNYVSIRMDGGFRIFNITNPSVIRYGMDGPYGITTNTYKIQISRVTKQLESSLQSETQILNQLNSKGYAVIQTNKYITYPPPVKSTKCCVVDMTLPIHKQLLAINDDSLEKYNYISLWSDGGYRLYNITDSSRITYGDFEGKTYIVANTSIEATLPSTNKNAKVEGFDIMSARANVSTQLGNLGSDLRNSQNVLLIDATNTTSSTQATLQSAQYASQIAQLVQSNLQSVANNIDTNTHVNLTVLQQVTKKFYNETNAYKSINTITRKPIQNEALYDIKNTASTNISLYAQNQDSINYTAPTLRRNKNILGGSQVQLTGRKQNNSTLDIYIYIELTILLVVTIATLVIVMTPFTKSQKLVYTLLLALFVIMNLFLVEFVFNKSRSIETFANNSDVSVSCIAFMNATSEYLVNTENITLLLESNNMYINTNDSLEKELTYYSSASQQLVNKNLEVQSVYKMYFIKQVKYNAIMQLCNTITLILVAFTIIYIGLEAFNLNFAYIWLYGISITLIILAAIICLIDIHIHVHSDPKQIYWRNPKSIS